MNFFGMGPMEIMVIMVVALIIFGPGKLPEIGATVGKAIREFRSATRELTGEFERTLSEVQGAADEVRQSAMEVQDVTRDAVRLDQLETPATAPSASLPRGQAPAPQPEVARVPTKVDPLADLIFGGADSASESLAQPSQSEAAPPTPATPIAFPDYTGGDAQPSNGLSAHEDEPAAEERDESLPAASESASRTVA